MAQASTLVKRGSLGLLLLALVCALTVREPRARQSSLTVTITVTDQTGEMIPSGTVTITRDGGTPKTGTLENGFANITGNFLSAPDYHVMVVANNYKQAEPPVMLPIALINDALKGNGILKLPAPIVMIKQGVQEPPPLDLGRLQQQLTELLPKHPELLDLTLEQVAAHEDLQKRVREQVKAGRHGWVAELITTPPPSAWSYWWVLLPVAFIAGLIADRALRRHAGTGHKDSSNTPYMTGVPPALNPPAQHEQTQDSQGNVSEMLEAKIGQLIQQQETLVGSINKVIERLPHDAVAPEVVVPNETAGPTQQLSQTDWSHDTSGLQFGDGDSLARASYKSLMHGGQCSPQAKYLDLEVKSSPKDMVGDKQVFLSEVSHSQGAFVLFAGDGGKGWVFPNPLLNFSTSLRPVFPHLGPGEFNNSKETIDPVPATLVGEDRWKVERRA